MIRKVASILVLLIVLMAPVSSSAEPRHSDIFLMTNEYQVGLANQLLIVIQPHDNLKYNKNYPSTARIAKKPIKLKTYGLYEKEHFLVEKDYVVVVIPFVPLEAGVEKVKIKLSYSLCNDTTCVMERVQYVAEVEIHD